VPPDACLELVVAPRRLVGLWLAFGSYTLLADQRALEIDSNIDEACTIQTGAQVISIR
jgi:hypothetical protein